MEMAVAAVAAVSVQAAAVVAEAVDEVTRAREKSVATSEILFVVPAALYRHRSDSQIRAS